MTITREQDLDRLDDIKHRHAMHRDPASERWRDIDTLLALHMSSRARIEECEKSHEDDLRRERAESDASFQKLREEQSDEIRACERELHDMEEHAGKLQKIIDNTLSSALAFEAALDLERERASYLELVAVKLVHKHYGDNGIAQLRRKLEALNNKKRTASA